MNKTTNKLALICFKPKEHYLEFLNSFTNYEVYIIIDDNSVNYTELYSAKYTNLTFIQMLHKPCEEYGYKNATPKAWGTGWDKGLYYFGLMFKNSNLDTKVWIIEDDVFFYNEETLLRIDAKYPDYDLLSKDLDERNDRDGWFWWQFINIKLECTHYKSAMCAGRVSAKLLEEIRLYAVSNKELFFAEALFTTIAKAKCKGESCYCPAELQTLNVGHDYTADPGFVLNKDNLYHHVKNISKHVELRS